MNTIELIMVIIIWLAVGLFATLTLLMIFDAIISHKTGRGLPIFKKAIWNWNHQIDKDGE